MWQAITFFVALPLFYLIGDFYLRLFGRVARWAIAARKRMIQLTGKESA